MTKKVRRIWMYVACIVIAVGAVSAVWIYRSGFGIDASTSIYVDADDNVDSIRQKIVDGCKPQSIGVFRIYAALMGLEEHLNTGRYEVTPSMTMLQLVRRIRNHNEQPINLVVPSVRTMGEMVRSLSSQLMIDSASIGDYINDEDNLKALGYTKETFPCLFIPNTYEVYWDISAEKLIGRLKKENDVFWDEGRVAKLKEVSEYCGEEMTKEKVVTLASIVDSETANNAEKPDIAALYMNRMRIGMRLQSDPTVIFALNDFSIRRVSKEHLQVESPYNTYKYNGLPPGPIRVPSIAGIDAVLNHATHNYIYMCAKEDLSGTHNFAETYAEHLRNANKYIKMLNERNIH